MARARWAEDLVAPERAIPVLPDKRFNALAYALATEFGDEVARTRLAAFAESTLEPRWDGGEFTWGFGLNEIHPRGQMNATLMVGEAGGEGAWSRIFNEPNLRKFDQPTVVGVDYPAVGISEAWYDEAARTLTVTTDVGDASRLGQPTAFRITNVRDPQRVSVVRDGGDFSNWWTLPGEEIQIVTDINVHTFQIQVAHA